MADYITFIDYDEIVLSRTKDELLEQYLIIRGDFGEEQSRMLMDFCME